jgi:hypothetical protein
MKALNEFLNESIKLDYDKEPDVQWKETVYDYLTKIKTKSKAVKFIDDYFEYLNTYYSPDNTKRTFDANMQYVDLKNELEVILSRIDEFPEDFPLSFDIWSDVIENKVKKLKKMHRVEI